MAGIASPATGAEKRVEAHRRERAPLRPRRDSQDGLGGRLAQSPHVRKRRLRISDRSRFAKRRFD